MYCKRQIILMFLFVATVANAQVSDGNDQTGPRPITSPKAALERALAYTGLEQTMDTSGIKAEEVAKFVIARDSTTPFFSERIDGQEVWCVTFPGVKLDLEGWYPSVIANQCLRTFEVLIGPKTGALLRATAWCEEGREDISSGLTAQYAEKMIREAGEVYEDVAMRPPSITLIAALGEADICSPVMAREIHAQCILYTGWGSERLPIWAITCNDVPRIELGGPFGGREELRPKWPKQTTIRALIDATSGAFLRGHDDPLPLPHDNTR